MEGYYDYGPRTILRRPVGLIGFMGSGVAAVGHALGCKLGLPLLQLDRHVEHRAGMSLAALQLKRGEGERRSLEHTALARAARERPAGIVVLGDGALLDPASLAIAREQLQLVYVKRPLDALHAAVLIELSAAKGQYPEFVLSGVPSVRTLSHLLDLRAPGYAAAEVTLDAQREHPQRVCNALVEELALLGSP